MLYMYLFNENERFHAVLMQSMIEVNMEYIVYCNNGKENDIARA